MIRKAIEENLKAKATEKMQTPNVFLTIEFTSPAVTSVPAVSVSGKGSFTTVIVLFWDSLAFM